MIRAALCALALFWAAPSFADAPSSPRLEALARDTGPARLEQFWTEMAAKGTPLVEPAAGDPGRAIVTFLWRGPSDAAAPGVFGVFNEVPWTSGDPMRHLAGTDIWFRTYDLPAALRSPYTLIGSRTALPQLTWQREWQGETQTYDLFLDPLNQRTIDDIYYRRLTHDNVFEGPAAPPEAWENAAKPMRGQVVEFELASTILGNSRKIVVYQPPGSASGKKPGLLLLFDGLSYRTPGMVPEMLDGLIAQGNIPPLVAVMVDSLSPDLRQAELNASKPFERFVVTELMPIIRQRFDISPDPRDAIVAGASRGGLAAGSMALRHPDLFGNVIAQSAAFWSAPDEKDHETDWLARQYLALPRPLPVRFYIQPGSMESVDGMRGPNRRFHDMLAAKGYQSCYREFLGGHNFLHWRMALPEAIIAMTRPQNSADLCNAGPPPG
ncbi:alpha/beta hydrolase-fold protein [Niveispirillum sp. KHB5.9]|uniref:alpha/beta hydrolase-fold protein n=1 Tax=Niveispirillum sp. KHB5.9 TaxID=3400269 RepID=UPI003A8BCA7C